MKTIRILFFSLSCIALLMSSAHATVTPAVFPTGLGFGFQPNGTSSTAQTLTVYNLGNTSFNVTGIASSLKEYTVGGSFPVTVKPQTSVNFTVTFTPDSARSFNGNLTVSFDSVPSQFSTVQGVGTNPNAKASVSTSALSFASQPLGTTSPTQPVTITNNGTVSFHVTGVTLTYPFAQAGFSGLSTSVAPGKSLTLSVSFFPTAVGAANGTMLITYDVVPNAGLSLSGIGSAATGFNVTTYSTLPSATQKAAYQATLAASGGVQPYSWSLAVGSTLPAGLGITGSGLITGTVSSTVKTGTYGFSVVLKDSSSPVQSLTVPLSLSVFATTGAACNNISYSASDDSGPFVPITDLGSGFYLGAEQGGLYAAGSNTRPPAHDASGISMAQKIQPLDANGNPSPSGKIVLMSIGESVAQQPFVEFINLASVDPTVNPNLVIVDGATGGATAALLSAANNNFWHVINIDYLPNAGVTPAQVQVAWINDVNGGPTGTFPNDITALQTDYEAIARNLHSKFPNIKLAYYSSIQYTGYSNGVVNLSPEPYGYEAGFAVKNTIQDQINGTDNLNFDPAVGPVVAPWIDWAAYYWANGMLPRSDGLVWTCQDLKSDGTHPSDPAGRIKTSTQLLNFFKSDDTATIWFLKH